MKKFTLEFTVSENDEIVVMAIEGHNSCDMVVFHSAIDSKHLEGNKLETLAAKCMETFEVQQRLCT